MLLAIICSRHNRKSLSGEVSMGDQFKIVIHFLAKHSSYVIQSTLAMAILFQMLWLFSLTCLLAITLAEIVMAIQSIIELFLRGCCILVHRMYIHYHLFRMSRNCPLLCERGRVRNLLIIVSFLNAVYYILLTMEGLQHILYILLFSCCNGKMPLPCPFCWLQPRSLRCRWTYNT